MVVSLLLGLHAVFTTTAAVNACGLLMCVRCVLCVVNASFDTLCACSTVHR
jgi:hypothetical protein